MKIFIQSSYFTYDKTKAQEEWFGITSHSQVCYNPRPESSFFNFNEIIIFAVIVLPKCDHWALVCFSKYLQLEFLIFLYFMFSNKLIGRNYLSLHFLDVIWLSVDYRWQYWKLAIRWKQLL